MEYLAGKLGYRKAEEAEQTALIIERLARAQKSLIETQAIIFVECTESDLDMPTLPLFVEERNEDPVDDSIPSNKVCRNPYHPMDCDCLVDESDSEE